MIRVVNGQLRWQERDVIAMTSILGAEEAVRRRAPLIPSILKLASRKGVTLSPLAEKKLAEHITLRAEMAKLKKHPNTLPVTHKESRGFEHQRGDLNYIRQSQLSGYLNSSSTGVGKTLVSLLWANVICRSRRTLIICKNIAKQQWIEAIRFWIDASQEITVVEGTIEEQIRQARHKTGWVIGHWESLVHASSGYLRRPWGAIIMDEAQYMSNRNASRTETAFELDSPFKMVNTAHPFNKDPGQLFAILKFLYPQMYRSYWRFFHMHVRATPKRWGGFEIDGARRPKLLRWEIAPFTIHHTKLEVFKTMPRIERVRRTVSLSPRGRKEYDRLRKAVFAELAALGGGSKFVPVLNDLSRLTRMRQYMIDPGLIGGRESSVKYAAMADQLDEIAAPTVVFTSFKQAALRLGAYLLKHKTVGTVDYIYGGMVKNGKADQAKKRFLAGKTDALICVASAADTSLNLGKYGYLAHLDLPWTFGELEQAEGRVDRPEENTGKIVPTTAYRIVVEDTYEEKQERRLSAQHGTFHDVMTVGTIQELFA